MDVSLGAGRDGHRSEAAALIGRRRRPAGSLCPRCRLFGNGDTVANRG
jgi:hypothetical protein